MPKSGVQGLSYAKQQRMLAAIKRSRKLEKITMLDINSIHLGKPIELTKEQKKKINDWMDEKDDLIWKRGYNTALVKVAKATKVEPKDRDEQRLFIDNGDILIAKQTKRISALSINAIAMRLKLPYGGVEYFANKQRYSE